MVTLHLLYYVLNVKLVNQCIDGKTVHISNGYPRTKAMSWMIVEVSIRTLPQWAG